MLQMEYEGCKAADLVPDLKSVRANTKNLEYTHKAK